MLGPRTTRRFHKTLYGPEILQEVTMYMRLDDQKAGQIVKHDLFDCRWSMIEGGGEPLEGEMTSNARRVLHIPRDELDRVEVAYILPLFFFVDESKRIWDNEAPDPIIVKLFENHVCVPCRMLKGRRLQG